MLKRHIKKSFTFTLGDELYEPFASFMRDANIESESQAVRDLVARALAADQFTAAQRAAIRRLEAKTARQLHLWATENAEAIIAKMRSMQAMLDASAETEEQAAAALETPRAGPAPSSYPRPTPPQSNGRNGTSA